MSSDEEMSDATAASSSDDGEPVEVAVLSRSRRSSAGTRMTDLVGKAAADDEAFWGHKTWAEEGGFGRSGGGGSDSGSGGSSDDSDEASLSSGAGSYRLSEDDEEDRVDRFDSDFDESEDEADEEEETRRVAAREKQVRLEERRAKSKKRAGVYRDIAASAGRELMKSKMAKAAKKGGKKVRTGMGDGVNEGLMLNFPGADAPGGAVAAVPLVPGAAPAVAVTVAYAAPAAVTSAAATAAPAPGVSEMPKPRSRQTRYRKGQTAGKRSLRTATLAKTIETAASAKAASKETAKRQAKIASRERANPKKRKFTQEELLIEAANVTEPENSRWLLSRKRAMQQAEILHGNRHGPGGKGTGNKAAKVISKFNSRRGCYNTITFPEMDLIPEIFTRGGSKRARALSGSSEDHISESGSAAAERIGARAKADACAITGKKARYRCPKTLLGYHDLNAFKELRRRLAKGELKLALKGEGKGQARAPIAEGMDECAVRIRARIEKRSGGKLLATAIVPTEAVVVHVRQTIETEQKATANSANPREQGLKAESLDAAVNGPAPDLELISSFGLEAARVAATAAAKAVVEAAPTQNLSNGRGNPQSNAAEERRRRHVTIAAVTSAAVNAAIRAATPPRERKADGAATPPRPDPAVSSTATKDNMSKVATSPITICQLALRKYRKMSEDDRSDKRGNSTN